MGISTNRLAASLGALILCASHAANAQSLFTAQITTTSGGSAEEQTNSLLDVPDLFDTNNLTSVLAGFNPTTDSFSAVLDLRGLPTTLMWDPGALTLTFALLGESVTLDGTSLDDAASNFDAWLKGEAQLFGSTLTLTDVLQGLVEFSPVDPVAGNPNSLQSRMFQTDYRLGTQGPFTSEQRTLPSAPDQFGIGLDYGYAQAGSFGVHAVDLPIDYRLNFRNPKWSLLFSLPLSATFTENKWSILASGAFGFQYRPTNWWSLTPLARVGGAGSIDVGALAFLWSVTLTNHMQYTWRGVTIAMGNLGGYAKTIDGVEIGGYSFSYDLSNPIMTNGGTLSGDTTLELLGRPLGWRFFGWNTQVFGDAVYMDSQSEVGLGLAMLDAAGAAPFDSASLSLSYVFGNNDYDGLSLRARFRF